MKKGQSLSEYSIFLAIALVAIVAINVYVKRGLQGRYADVTDYAIDVVRAQANRDVGRQYEPYYVNENKDINMPRPESRIIVNRGRIIRSISPSTTEVNTRSTEGVNVEGTMVEF